MSSKPRKNKRPSERWRNGNRSSKNSGDSDKEDKKDKANFKQVS